MQLNFNFKFVNSLVNVAACDRGKQLIVLAINKRDWTLNCEYLAVKIIKSLKLFFGGVLFHLRLFLNSFRGSWFNMNNLVL